MAFIEELDDDDGGCALEENPGECVLEEDPGECALEDNPGEDDGCALEDNPDDEPTGDDVQAPYARDAIARQF